MNINGYNLHHCAGGPYQYGFSDAGLAYPTPLAGVRERERLLLVLGPPLILQACGSAASDKIAFRVLFLSLTLCKTHVKCCSLTPTPGMDEFGFVIVLLPSDQ